MLRTLTLRRRLAHKNVWDGINFMRRFMFEKYGVLNWTSLNEGDWWTRLQYFSRMSQRERSERHCSYRLRWHSFVCGYPWCSPRTTDVCFESHWKMCEESWDLSCTGKAGTFLSQFDCSTLNQFRKTLSATSGWFEPLVRVDVCSVCFGDLGKTMQSRFIMIHA